ncbi:MAG: hypothetical protein H6672_20570 [Anaerolineaceae bacterium]|nr:hypothetical protein [Anaerolineaceae bacterium]
MASSRADQKNPSQKPVLPPRPALFHITEPFEQRGIWSFWLTAEPDVIQFVRHLSCVLQVVYNGPAFFQRPSNRVMVTIDPRYDHEAAWLWIHDQLETESLVIELPEEVETALDEAIPEDTNNPFW